MVTNETSWLGRLVNRVRLSTEYPEWRFGTRAVMRDLAWRGLTE